jgi:rhodanese-related sulfurtransferase
MNLFGKNRSKLIDILTLIFFLLGTTLIVEFLLGERTADHAISSKNFLTFVETEKPVIIDLRESDEINKSPLFYPSIIHHSFLELQQDLSALDIDSSKTYLLVCTDGNRSRLIASLLSSRGIYVPYLQDGLWGVPAEQLAFFRKGIK